MIPVLAATEPRTDQERPAWAQPVRYWSEMQAATAHLPAPLVALGIEALRANAADLVRRAGGLPIRVASKSIRVRAVLDAVLALPGYRGILAYTLSEALWLARSHADIVVAYPTVDRAAIAELAADPELADRVTVMIDDIEQLELIDRVAPPSGREAIRVCLDFDASFRAPALGRIGVLRSPVCEPAALRRLAEEVLRRPGFVLDGIMSYEAQIAGVGDRPSDRPGAGAVVRAMQRASAAELAERRAAAVAGVREVAELRFVNGGGTGSLERTAADGSVTELAAGSGLYGPHLFDGYRAFTPAPAVAFALDVVRRPSERAATVLGGGWIASGPAGEDRLPQAVWPTGLAFAPREGAGEVQTPVVGDAARGLRIGDRVWFRHAKSGEPMEHVDAVVPVLAGQALDPVPTYRGEGRCFL